MDSNRLIINNIDQSTATTSATTTISGFTVVKAPKGPITPIRVPAGKTSMMQDIFGLPSKEYPELYEAATFNREYDTFISAPYESAEVPVAYVTKYGIFPSANLVTYNEDLEALALGTKDISDFSEGEGITGITKAPEKVSVLKNINYPRSTGSSTEIGSDLGNSNYPGFLDNNVIIKTGLKALPARSGLESGETLIRISNLPYAVGGKEKVHYIDLKVDTSKKEVYLNETKVGTTDTEEVGSTININLEGADGVTELSTSKIKNVFQDENVRKNLRIDYKEDLNWDTDVFAVIYPKYPSERFLHISFDAFNKSINYTPNTVYGKNLLNMHVYEDKSFHDKNKPLFIQGSLDSSSKNGFGSYLGFTSTNASYTVDQNLIAVHVVRPFSGADIVDNIKLYPAITLDGGTRSLQAIAAAKVTSEEETKTVDVHEKGWSLAKNEDYVGVDLFFDSSLHEFTMAAGSAPTLDLCQGFLDIAKVNSDGSPSSSLAGCIFNATPEYASLRTVSNDNSSMPISIGPNYWNICNEAIVELSKTGERFKSPLTGARSLMQARIIGSRWGGVAPMYLNSGSPAVGGVLNNVLLPGSSIINLRYKYTKDEQTFLDSLNMNPIIKDNVYGVMVVGQKTCKEGAITDWSYIGHVSAFLNFEKEVRENVMIPQLGKANNDYYRTLRKQQVEQLLSKRLNGNNRIWAAAVVDTSTADGINDITNRRARKFIIDVKVKVDVFSEYVVLNFTNVDQETTL